jgi:signal transduction histidine kinase
MEAEKWRHDLKNQLGIVVGFSELLLSEMDAADRHRADIEEIHTAAQRALDLLSHVGSPGNAGNAGNPGNNVR